jgi:hypothetical protein
MQSDLRGVGHEKKQMPCTAHNAKQQDGFRGVEAMRNIGCVAYAPANNQAILRTGGVLPTRDRSATWSASAHSPAHSL